MLGDEASGKSLNYEISDFINGLKTCWIHSMVKLLADCGKQEMGPTWRNRSLGRDPGNTKV
jgi:hypothetical protein